jgi:hypothetical protein
LLPIAIIIIAIATVDVVVFFIRSILVEPGAHFAKRDEEPDARTERVVVPLGLEGRSYQIGRDDVQVDVSFVHFIFFVIAIIITTTTTIIFIISLVPACVPRRKEREIGFLCEM